MVTDHFTCYAQAYPTKDQKASMVSKVLLEKGFWELVNKRTVQDHGDQKVSCHPLPSARGSAVRTSELHIVQHAGNPGASAEEILELACGALGTCL